MSGLIDTNVITRITMKKHRIRWTIENVSKVEAGKTLTGPCSFLTPTCLVDISFKTDGDDLFVYVSNKLANTIQIEIILLLFDCNDKKLYEDKNETKIFTIGNDEEVDIIRGVLDRKRFDALPNDTLIIDLSICLRGRPNTEIINYPCTADPREQLIEDFKTMQEKSINSDVSLQIGNDQIFAHWSVLCSRSPYFKRMFDSEMLERIKNSIKVTDISLDTLKKLIHFLYTADFEENEEDDIEELFDLYYAADKYEVLDMRRLCSSKIIAKATADNVCQIFQFAHEHNDKNFKMQAVNFIRIYSDAVFQTDGWKEFEASEPLAAELLCFCLKRDKLAC